MKPPCGESVILSGSFEAFLSETIVDGTVRIIALMNQKGGVGKTTTTVNLGAALAEAGRRVLLIDLDPQAHLTLHTGIDPTDQRHSVYDLLMDADLPAEAAAHRVGERLDVIGAEVDLAGAEQELHGAADRHAVLKRKISSIAGRYDFVLIDCPPSLGLLTMNALVAANEVIVPMQAHFLALQGLSKLLETVQLVRQHMNTSLKVTGVVLCAHEGFTKLAGEVVADLQNFFDAARKFAMPWSGAKIFQPPVRKNIKLAECPSFGQTIFQYEPACAGAQDYRALGEAVLGHSMPNLRAVREEHAPPAHLQIDIQPEAAQPEQAGESHA